MRRFVVGGFRRWWDPLFSDLKGTGLRSLIGALVSLVLLKSWVGVDELRIEIITILAALGGGIAANLLALVGSIIAEPFRIIKEQDKTISGLRAIADQKAILTQLHDQRDIGIPLSNVGQAKVHTSSEAGWWQEFEQWKLETIDTIATLDANRARKWAKLGRFTPKRPFPGALNRTHEKHLQMADEWIIRLDAEIDYWEEKIPAVE